MAARQLEPRALIVPGGAVQTPQARKPRQETRREYLGELKRPKTIVDEAEETVAQTRRDH